MKGDGSGAAGVNHPSGPEQIERLKVGKGGLAPQAGLPRWGPRFTPLLGQESRFVAPGKLNQ